MTVKLRLARYGTKKRPFYRIVAADSKNSRDGKFIELVGTYNPLSNPVITTLKEERIKYWLGEGAMPSDTVKSILKKEGIKAASF